MLDLFVCLTYTFIIAPYTQLSIFLMYFYYTNFLVSKKGSCHSNCILSGACLHGLRICCSILQINLVSAFHTVLPISYYIQYSTYTIRSQPLICQFSSNSSCRLLFREHALHRMLVHNFRIGGCPTCQSRRHILHRSVALLIRG